MNSTPAPDPFARAQLGPITLRNRIVKAATFEGVTREHVVSDALIEFHRRVAAGGVGMTTPFQGTAGGAANFGQNFSSSSAANLAANVAANVAAPTTPTRLPLRLRPLA